MIEPSAILPALATVLGTAAVTTVLCQRLHLPVVLGYLLAGILVGPSLALPSVSEREIVATLAEIGVILLMFSLGLEFSLKKLTNVGLRAVATATIETSAMLAIGYNLGLFWGWEPKASFVMGCILAISSTTIVAKTFEEHAVAANLREAVIGVLVVEDLIAIGLLTVLTTMAGGSEVSWTVLAQTGGRLAIFLATLLSLGLLLVPRMMRYVVRLRREETTIVASVGLCFAIATLAHAFGYSVALGAFLAGSLVSESGQGKLIERRVRPVRDIFAAIFFVSVGMLIDPGLLGQQWHWIILVLVLVLIGKTLGVTTGALVSGHSLRTSAQMGFTLAQNGEFSLIIAGLGVGLGIIPTWITPVVVAVVALTTLSTPILTRVAEPAAMWIEGKLPRPLQNLVLLYATWMEGLAAPASVGPNLRMRRLLRLLFIDALALTLLIVASDLGQPAIIEWAASQGNFDFPLHFVRWLLTGLTLVLALPFVVGLMRIARGLGVELARRALPLGGEGATDLADAPRRAMVLILQFTVLLVVCLPLVALVQPFVPAGSMLFVVVALVVGLAPALWKSATNLQGHVRAGSEVVAEVLLSHSRVASKESAHEAGDTLKKILPGLGDPEIYVVPQQSPIDGKSIGELQLRGRSGASILALVRGSESHVAPGAAEVLRCGDCIALVGTREAIASAKLILAGDATVNERRTRS
jgi:CPA2 family monovalent cation:H+ antiporter-2